jgi:hypothetical protein
MTMMKQTEKQITRQESHTAQRVAGVLFGAIEALLVFRLVFKLLGANVSNAFVSGIYTVSHFLVGIFEGIFSRIATGGNPVVAVFEPATLIAMVVVAFIAWVVLKLFKPREGVRSEKTEYTQNDNQKK